MLSEPSNRHRRSRWCHAGTRRDRYETASYALFLSNRINIETWEEHGSITTPERANKMWKLILNEFEAPPMDEAIRDELETFVALRKEQGGAPTDF